MEHPPLPTSLESFEGYSYDNGESEPVDQTALVQLTAERLYALSKYGWLSVIGPTEPDHLRLVGQAKVKAKPFQLHVLGSTAVGLFNDCEDYQEGAPRSGCIVAFDVSAPNGPMVKEGYPIGGKIENAKLTGHILYVVARDTESGTARVITVDIGVPRALVKVDERRYPKAPDAASGWVPSVKIAEQRIYVASPRLQDAILVGSAIAVVDASDPNGRLVDVAALEAVGRVEFDWQMDEAGSVLRLVSVPLKTEPNCLQTFSVSSAPLPAPLARLDLDLGGYAVSDVRFDGTRAYALHHRGGYSLATLDLADPANPKYAGNIELSGEPFQIVAKGERLVTLTAVDRVAGSRPDASLFDVAELSVPRLLAQVKLDQELVSSSSSERAWFGPMQLFEAEHLIAIPFSMPRPYPASLVCSGVPRAGVQLIDWGGDALALTGTADAVRLAQRVALHADRLLVVSSPSAQTFDINARQAPQLRGELKLTETATRLLDAGRTLARVSVDPWKGSVRVETSSPGDIEKRVPSGSIDVQLSPVACGEQWSLENVLAGKDRVYVLASESDFTRYRTDPPRETRIVTIDVTNAAEPRVIDESTFNLGIGWQYYRDYRVPRATEMTALVGNALVAMGREPLSLELEDHEYWVRNSLHVFDVSTSKPHLVRTIPLPVGRGTTGLLATGTSIVVSRYVEVPTNAERVRFHVDRLDVSDPNAPLLYPPVNVPGAVVAYDEMGGRAVTLDYLDARGAPVIRLVDLGPPSLDSAMLLGSVRLESNQEVFSIAQGDNRVFALANTPLRNLGCRTTGTCTSDPVEQPLSVIGGVRTGGFEQGRVTVSANSIGRVLVTASGRSAVVSAGWRGQLLVVDAAEVSAPRIVEQLDALAAPVVLTSVHGGAITLSPYGGVRSFPLLQ